MLFLPPRKSEDPFLIKPELRLAICLYLNLSPIFDSLAFSNYEVSLVPRAWLQLSHRINSASLQAPEVILFRLSGKAVQPKPERSENRF